MSRPWEYIRFEMNEIADLLWGLDYRLTDYTLDAEVRARTKATRDKLKEHYESRQRIDAEFERTKPLREAHAAEIERVVKAEEERFRETLDRGMREFDELARRRQTPSPPAG